MQSPFPALDLEVLVLECLDIIFFFRLERNHPFSGGYTLQLRVCLFVIVLAWETGDGLAHQRESIRGSRTKWRLFGMF